MQWPWHMIERADRIGATPVKVRFLEAAEGPEEPQADESV
jgi:hypothetical protein